MLKSEETNSNTKWFYYYIETSVQNICDLYILELCRITVECLMKPCFWHVRWGMYLDSLRQRTKLWKPTKPRARGGCFIRGGYKGKYQIYVKLRFETLDIIFNDLWPQKWIPGYILILLDTHNLSVFQKLPIKHIAIIAILLCHLPFLANLKMTIFDVQTSYGGLKVSEFNQEFISEV